MSAYYNEIDPYAAQWLRNLIAAGRIAPGDVDERSIAEVHPTDLIRYTQCHFFAGIGVWSYALRLAGWPDGRPVWTGSCPCQPFSAAGKGEGTADPRHLWPEWARLIRGCRPVAIFGEQVAAAIRHGWLDAVCADLEGFDYAVGAAVVGAHSVGAPHIRQRLWFVADSKHAERRPQCGPEQDERDGQNAGWAQTHGRSGARSAVCELANADGRNASTEGLQRGGEHGQQSQDGGAGGAGTSTFWSNAIYIPCIDGKARPTKPGLFPLAHGVAGRVGRLRAYGNAIVPQVAAAFVMAALEPQGEAVSVPREVYDSAVALVPLLEEGWDEYDMPEDQNIGAKAIDRFIAAVRAMLYASPAEKEKP